MKIFLISFSLALFGLACQNNKKTVVDRIIYNAHIITLDDSFQEAEVMVIKNGKILAIGNKSLLEKYTCRRGNMQDIKGQFVYPGLIDAHCHFYGYAKTLLTCNLVGTKSWDDALNRLDNFVKNNPSAWIQGRGWDQNDWAVKEYPNNDSLNKRYPNTPVILKRIDGHAAICNNKALEIAGILPEQNSQIKILLLSSIKQSEGGEIILKNGIPTGVLIDHAVDLVQKHVTEPSQEELVKALQNAEKECYGFGLTTLADAGLDLKECQFLDSISQKKLISMYLYLMLNPNESGLNYAQKNGILENNNTYIGSFKLYADGALGSRGAKMKRDYCDQRMHAGMLMNSPKYYEDFCNTVFNKTQYQVNTHCIGDSANKLILDLYGKLLNPADDRRWRIEHAQILDPKDFYLFGKFGIIPSVQPTHASSDAPWVKDRICEDRMEGAYAYKTLLKQNGYIPLGTDFPVEYINPFYTFYSAVFRQNANVPNQAAFLPQESLSPLEALKGMTIWAAKACKLDHRKGSLKQGKDADFVVMDKNLLTVKKEDVLKTKVKSTYRAGVKVF
jgi:predicted amidohydrolase YtcJ